MRWYESWKLRLATSHMLAAILILCKAFGSGIGSSEALDAASAHCTDHCTSDQRTQLKERLHGERVRLQLPVPTTAATGRSNQTGRIDYWDWGEVCPRSEFGVCVCWESTRWLCALFGSFCRRAAVFQCKGAGGGGGGGVPSQVADRRTDEGTHGR